MNKKTRRPVVLTVLDGWGMGPNTPGNAITQAKLENFPRMLREYPNTIMPAHGLAVGLPEDQMGGSEVGHLSLGAGRIVYQGLTYLNHMIEIGEFQTNEVIVDSMLRAKRLGKAVHLMGLLSPGGVHSHQEHVYVLMEMAQSLGVEKLYIHAFLDGRDTPPQSAIGYLRDLECQINTMHYGKIATICGRYYAMDRDKRWDRLKLAWDAIVNGKGKANTSAVQAIGGAYRENRTDEFAIPTVIVDEEGNPVGKVEDQDSVIFFNFRADRARQLAMAFMDPDFEGFDVLNKPNVDFVCMMEYVKDLDLKVAFPMVHTDNTLGEVISKAGLRQLRIAETEKFAHVTFFFNGGREAPFPGEDRILVPSPKVPTYDIKPEMSALEVTDKAVKAILSNGYDFILINFANSDMVGHTGKMEATIKAVRCVDSCVGHLESAVKECGGILIVTADHGNSDEMINIATNGPATAHSLAPVPFIVCGEGIETIEKEASFKDVAVTVLDLLGLEKPQEMTGRSLIN